MSQPSPYVSHFVEFRKRIIFCVLSFCVIVSPLILFAPKIYSAITSYLLFPIPNASLIATEVTSTFMIPLKLALTLGLLLSLPLFMFQAWSFVAPGLYPHEKKPVLWLTLISSTLFYVGIGFAYFLVCPLALKFFAYIAPSNVQVMTDMSHYLNFISKMSFSFGLAFQVPILVCVALMAGVCTPESLKRKRPLIIVSAFVIGMLLTPPDVISQCMLAIPLIGLFEFGVVLFYWLKPNRLTATEKTTSIR